MNKLENVKKVIKENFNQGSCGIFNSRNFVGDPMYNIYDDGEVQIDICYHWSYFEVFGLSREEFDELKTYYNELEESTDES